MIKPMIEFCASNMHHGTYKLLEQYEDEDLYEVTEYGCLSNCEACYLKPFALVEGTIVDADTVDELHDRIQQFLKDEEERQSALDKILEEL